MDYKAMSTAYESYSSAPKATTTNDTTNKGLGSPTTPKKQEEQKPSIMDRFKTFFTEAGGTIDPPKAKPNPIGFYDTPDMQETKDYLQGVAVEDALYDAQGMINQAYTPQMRTETRPMTKEEIQKYAPIKELTEKGITVEQLSAMPAQQQKATLESLGITNAQWVSHTLNPFERFQQGIDNFAKNVAGVPEQRTPFMSLEEFDKQVMESVHSGYNPNPNPFYDPLDTKTPTLVGEQFQPSDIGGSVMPSREDVAAGAPSAEQVAVMPDAPGMMVPATLGEEPSVDTVGGAGLMSRRLDQKPVTKHSGPFEDSAKGKDEFLKAIIPVAKEVGNDIGLDWRLIVAQGAIESGWGSTVKGNAFMGVKAHGAKDTVTFGTQEVIDGKRISMDDSFRAYDSLESAVRDYGKFLQSNPRYKDYLKANTLEDATKALQASKYATAPNYGESVLVTAKGRTLNSFLERNPEYKDVTETITREDTTLDQSPRPMARPEAKAVVEAKLDTATTVPEVTAAVTEAAVSTMPKEEAAKLLTNPVQWVYENNLVGLNEDTELGADAIDGFFRTATPKGIDALQRDAQGRISSTNNSWCAVFIDHVLRGIGANAVDPKTAPRGSKEPGQRKYSAMRAFEYGNYGDSVKTADAKAGDLVILSRSHIGIYTGKKDAKGRMLVLGGNQSTKTSKGRGVSVNVAAYDVGGIKSIRRISNIDDLPTDTLKALTKDMTGTAAGTR